VIRNALPAIANEMAVDLQRTSYNMMIYEVRDFCTALVNVDGSSSARTSAASRISSPDLGVIITDAMKRYGRKGFQPGDVLITNHQAVAGQHLNNIVVYVPCFFRGELLAFSMVRAHWIDGRRTSTGFGAGPEVPDPWQEGLQLDQLKIYRRESSTRRCTASSATTSASRNRPWATSTRRSPRARLGARRIDELFRKYGRSTVLAAIAGIFDETETKCRKVVARLADGVYEAESLLRRRRRHAERARAHPRQGGGEIGTMTIDLSGCSAERKAAVNSRTLAAARVAYKALTGPLDPVNEGSFRALEVIIPEGTS